MSHCSFLVRASFRSLRSTIRAVSPPFGEEPWSSQCGKQLGSLLYVGCRHRSLNCTRAAAEARPNNSSRRFSKNGLFISLQRTQAAMKYYCESLSQEITCKFNSYDSVKKYRLYSGYVLFMHCNIAHSRLAKRQNTQIQSRTHI